MVTAKTQYNLKNAREYFEEHLCVGGYYNEGQRIDGEWTGLGAERLGLSGKVRANYFLRLCENQHPATRETQRGLKMARTLPIVAYFTILRSPHPSPFHWQDS